MLGDAVIQMPPDVPSTSVLELDSPPESSNRPKGITRLTVNISTAYNEQVKAQPHPAPRWRTPEFMLYYVVFACALPVMFWIPYRLSSCEYWHAGKGRAGDAESADPGARSGGMHQEKRERQAVR